MATTIDETARAREPLTRDRILAAAVALADEGGATAGPDDARSPS